MPRRTRRWRLSAPSVTYATVDTSWVIAAEKDPAAARRHIAALTRIGQVLVVTPPVTVEAQQRSRSPGRLPVVLARLARDPVLPEDGDRAAELLREAGRQSSEPSARIREIGTNDALIAAIAERLGGIVYTDDATHLNWLRQAGARITVATVPF